MNAPESQTFMPRYREPTRQQAEQMDEREQHERDRRECADRIVERLEDIAEAVKAAKDDPTCEELQKYLAQNPVMLIAMPEIGALLPEALVRQILPAGRLAK